MANRVRFVFFNSKTIIVYTLHSVTIGGHLFESRGRWHNIRARIAQNKFPLSSPRKSVM